MHDLNGKLLRKVDLPGIGTAAASAASAKTKRLSTPSPASSRRPRSTATIRRRARVPCSGSPRSTSTPTQYETKQVFYNSKDGTRVPMFLTYKKGLKLDGQNPTLLYGYGGFDISLTPAFSVPNRGLAGDGRLYAQPNLRGGGEYGEEWHQAGTKPKKQNVFDDFIAAAEWLIANKYTSTPKLAIRGGSNGGLLVGACVTQRPDLFGATLAAGRRDGHAALPEVHDRLGVDFGLRIVGQCRGFQGSVRLFAAAQPEAGNEVSADADYDGRSRRPRGAGTQLQVRRDHASRSGRAGAGADPH